MWSQGIDRMADPGGIGVALKIWKKTTRGSLIANMVHLLEPQQSKEEDHFSDITLWLKQNKTKRSICETVTMLLFTL